MTTRRPNLIKGSLDLLVLKVLSKDSRSWVHGHEPDPGAQWGEILIEEGSLYPALHRMERQGWIDAEWGLSELNRRAKFYCLTRRGRKELAARERDWRQMTKAIARVLRPASAGA